MQECEQEFYPNIRKLLQVFAVLLVSVAECERCFSVLKRLKTYLRSTMAEERLVGLTLIDMHHDMCPSAEVLAEKFMARPSRRVIK